MEQKLKTLKLILTVLYPIITAALALLIAHAIGIAFENITLPGSGFLAFHLALCMASMFCGWRLLDTKQQQNSLSSYFQRLSSTFLVGGVAIINLFVAISATLDFSVRSFYAIPLTILGVIIGWIYLLLLADQEDQNNSEKESDDTAEIAAAESKQETTASVWGGLYYGALSGIGWLIYLIAFAFGTYYFYILKAALIDGAKLNVLRILRGIPTLIEKVAPNLLAIAVVIPLIYIGYGLWNATIAYIRKSDHPDINRDLSDAEIDLIDQCIEKLEETIKTYHKTWIEYVVWALYFVSMCTLFAAIFWFVLMDTYGVGGRLFQEDRIAGLSWSIYSDPIGVTDIALVFVAILAPGSVIMWVCGFHQRLFVASVLEQKKEGVTDPNDRLGKLRNEVALDVRKRHIKNAALFEPIKYLRMKHQRLAKMVHYCSLGVISVTFCFWVLDRRSYVLTAHDGVTHVSYWSGEKHHTPYGQIADAHIQCGESGDNGFRLWLEATASNSTGVKVFDYENGRTIKMALPESIDAIENAVTLLRESGASVALYTGETKLSDEQYKEKIEDCRAGITKLVDAPTAERIVSLVRKTQI